MGTPSPLPLTPKNTGKALTLGLGVRNKAPALLTDPTAA